MELAGRGYARVYDVQGRADIHAFLQRAVEASGAQVLYASDAGRAPVYLGVRTASGESLGLLIYPFRMTQVATRGRPRNEVRGQIRYGAEDTWRNDDHHIGRDIAGVDITLMLGVHLPSGVMVGLNPALYDPLPMGISIYANGSALKAATASTWHVWDHKNRAGSRRSAPRASGGVETLVAFTAERLLDYARFERAATDLGLDAPLRFRAAQDAANAQAGSSTGVHPLEADFDLAAAEILAIIAERTRLQVAVRGGVAEHHLQRELLADLDVHAVRRLDQDSLHDLDVTMLDGQPIRVECKNASPHVYADGSYKVEVQKTRASQKDPASRFYRADQFDVVAACLYSATRQWVFRYALTSQLTRHRKFPNHLAAMQRVDASWSDTLAAALKRHSGA